MTPEPINLVTHYGAPIAAYLSDETVTEICVNRWDQIFVERRGRLAQVEGTWRDEENLVSYIKSIAHKLGQEVNDRNPILDARLHDGTRINAVLRPTAVYGPCLSIRPYPKVQFTLDDLIGFGGLPEISVEIFRHAIDHRLNAVVNGGTGSGKTTLLRGLCGMIDKDERIVTVEDTAENLVGTDRHVVSFEAAKRDMQGGAAVTMARLIANSLRQRPDRIVVGEIREPDAATAYIDAINTGHAGALTTVHANNAREALTRLQILYARAASNITLDMAEVFIKQNIDLVIFQTRERDPDGTVARRVKEIATVSADGVNYLVKHRHDTGFEHDEQGLADWKRAVEETHH